MTPRPRHPDRRAITLDRPRFRPTVKQPGDHVLPSAYLIWKQGREHA